MPNWKEFADLLGMAQFGDDVRAARERKRKKDIEAEELGFRRSANQRADAAAGRDAEKFDFEKSTFDSQRKQLEQRVKSGELSLQEAQNKLDEYAAAGGAEGAGQRTVETHTLRKNEDERAGARLGIEQGRASREAELHPFRKRGAELEQEFQEGTVDARMDAINDPTIKDSQLLNSIAQALTAAVRAGDVEQAKQLKGDFDVLRGEIMKKKAIAEVWRESKQRARAGNPSPYDVFLK